MIAKISHGSSLYGVLAYNQLKVDERHADVLFTSRIIEPQGDNSYTIGLLSRSFGDYLTANRKTEKPVLHISLNPDPKDCLSEERFVSLAEEYMRRMGFGDQPYIVYRHNDIGREHLHIVSVRVDETGRAISDSYEHGRSMKVCRELERQFGLVPATPKQWKEGLPLSPVGYGDGNLKGQLAGVIRPLAREWRFRTLGEYRAVLSLYGITVDEVKGEYGGREYHGLTYSATDREGNKVGKPFKSSVFGKEAGVAALERRMHNAAAWEKTHREVAAATAGKVAAAMQTAGHDRAQFERELMGQGIGVVFRQNEAGRIYGATFIDHAAKAVFNGSRLGKEFSAGVFNDLFAGQEGIHLPQPSAGVEHPTRQQEQHKDGTTQNVAAAFNLFAPVPGGASCDQPVPPRKRKKNDDTVVSNKGFNLSFQHDTHLYPHGIPTSFSQRKANDRSVALKEKLFEHSEFFFFSETQEESSCENAVLTFSFWYLFFCVKTKEKVHIHNKTKFYHQFSTNYAKRRRFAWTRQSHGVHACDKHFICSHQHLLVLLPVRPGVGHRHRRCR